MYIDLTMELSVRTPVRHVVRPPFETKTAATIEHDGWNEQRVSFNTHTSTHIEAPFHMLAEGKKLNDFPFESFLGRAKIIDARGVSCISHQDIGDISGFSIVLFWAEQTKKAFKPSFFDNNPVLDELAAQSLIDQNVQIVGLDSFSPDNAPFTIHKLLFSHDIRIVENLINLDQVYPECDLTIAPLNIINTDAAPCRVVAKK